MISLNIIFKHLLSRGGHPALVYYGSSHQRVELSNYVLASHAMKVAGYLQTQNYIPGDNLLLYSPNHWRAAIWALGSWTNGLTVYPTQELSELQNVLEYVQPQVIVTNEPKKVENILASTPQIHCPDTLVAINLEPLAIDVPGLPWNWDDGLADIAKQPDLIQNHYPVSGTNIALSKPDNPLLYYEDDFSKSLNTKSLAEGYPHINNLQAFFIAEYPHHLVLQTEYSDVESCILACAQAWSQDKTLILISEEYDNTARDRLVRQEIVTTHYETSHNITNSSLLS